MANRCRAYNKRGESCQGRIVDMHGLCPAHSGAVDMQAIGRKGGKVTQYGRLAAFVGADDELRAKARDRLVELLDSSDPKIAFQAALIVLEAHEPALRRPRRHDRR